MNIRFPQLTFESSNVIVPSPQIPVELTYLQLTFLDLAANRLSCLPVELRFMVTLVELHLEENPLTCPPANLCGRGRVHIFKYLEIQVGCLKNYSLVNISS